MLQKRFNNRLISTLLIFCFVFATMIYSLPVYAVDSLIENEIIGTVTPNDEFVVGEKLVLKQTDVPEIMSFSEAQSKGHVYRLRERETDMNTLIFLSDDNTQTMYVYPQAVKYVDADGNIKDKSTALTASGSDLVMADNDVNVRFPQSINHGITVSKDDKSISMMPSAVSTSTRTVPQSSKIGKNNKAIYTDAFGDGISLEYTATFSGVKEDIILESYTGKTEFSFVINTNGLYPVKNSNGSVSFYDPSTDAVVAEMMQVYCIDAANNFAGGDIEITEMKQNQKYIFTVVPDVEFLTADTTVYPVTVDPTITMNGSATVEDAVIYSGKPTHNYGDHRYATIGYLDSSYKIGEYLVKFPELAEKTFFYSTQISSAYFHIYTASGKSATTTIGAYGFKTAWTESTVKWNTVYPDAVTTACISTTTVPSSGTQKMSVNILNIARSWAQGFLDPAEGILLRNSNETSASVARDFLTVEYAVSKNMAYMPYLEINISTEGAQLIVTSKPPTTMKVKDTFQCEAIYVENGIIEFNSRDDNLFFSFESSKPAVASFVSDTGVDNYDILTAKTIGTTQITVWYYEDVASSTFSVTVVPNIEIVVPTSKTLNYETNSSYNINAYLKTATGNGSADANIIYEKKYNSNPNNIPYTLSADGKVALEVEDEGFAHTVGTFTVTAKSSQYPDYVYKDIVFNVTCTPSAVGENSEMGISRLGGRYIKIGYSDIGLNNASELNELVDLYNLGDGGFEPLIDINFQDENGWIFYEKDMGSFDQNKKLFELIGNSRIACIVTHGITEGNMVGSISMNSDGSVALSASDINALHDGYFSYCHIVMFTACNSGTTSSDDELDNLAYAIQQKGAKVAIGYTISVDETKARIFEHAFFNLLRNDDQGTYLHSSSDEFDLPASRRNSTIENAVKYAAEYAGLSLDDIAVYGDTKKTLSQLEGQQNS